jgi:hypothetical protein
MRRAIGMLQETRAIGLLKEIRARGGLLKNAMFSSIQNMGKHTFGLFICAFFKSYLAD